MFAEKPDAARAELGRVARAVLLVCHEAHLLRVLLSGKPGAVQVLVGYSRLSRCDVMNRTSPLPPGDVVAIYPGRASSDGYCE
jgi:hypothetical protein